MSVSSSQSPFISSSRYGSLDENAADKPEALLALSVSASRFSASFNDGKQSTLRLIRRRIDTPTTRQENALLTSGVHTRTQGHKITTGAALADDHLSGSVIAAVETAPLVAVEGTPSSTGESATHVMASALANIIADRLCAPVRKPADGPRDDGDTDAGASTAGEEVLTYALGHTRTGKTAFLLGSQFCRADLDGEGGMARESATRPALPNAGLLERVLQRVFSSHNAVDARVSPSCVVAMSVLEVSEAPSLTPPLHDGNDTSHAHEGDPMAVDLLSGRRGPLLGDPKQSGVRSDCSDGVQREHAPPRDGAQFFMADAADIPAAQYVRVTSATEAMTVVCRALSRAQSWRPLSGDATAPVRAHGANTGEPRLHHLCLTVVVVSTYRSDASGGDAGVAETKTRTSVWKLWDLCGPPAVPVCSQPDSAAVFNGAACWSWPLAVRQRLQVLGTFLTSPSSGTDTHDDAETIRSSGKTVATAIVSSARRSASFAVVLGSVLYDACAHAMNAYTLQHMCDWQHWASPPSGPHAHDSDRAGRRAENTAAAEKAALWFSLSAGEWLARVTRDAAHAERVAAHDARHQQLTLATHHHAFCHSHTPSPDLATASTGAAHDATPVTGDERPVAVACALHYTRDLSILSAASQATTHGRADASSAEGELVTGDHNSGEMVVASSPRDEARPPVNRAAQAARAAARHEDDRRRRFLCRPMHTSKVRRDEGSPGTAPALPTTVPPLALMNASICRSVATVETTPKKTKASRASSPSSSPSPSASDTPRARSSPPPSATAQTVRPDACTRQAQQRQRALESTLTESSSTTDAAAPLFTAPHLTIHSETSEMTAQTPVTRREEATPMGTWTVAEWRQYVSNSLAREFGAVAAVGEPKADQLDSPRGPLGHVNKNNPPDNHNESDAAVPHASGSTRLIDRLETAVWQVVAPLAEQCVRSTQLANAAQASWLAERAHTREMAERMSRLEAQLAQLLTTHTSAATKEVDFVTHADCRVATPESQSVSERLEGRELSTPISSIAPCHDRSLSASLSISASANAGPHGQLADLLARTVVRSGTVKQSRSRPSRSAKRVGQSSAARDSNRASSQDDDSGKAIDTPGTSAEEDPLFRIELVEDLVPDTAGHLTAQQRPTAATASVSTRLAHRDARILEGDGGSAGVYGRPPPASPSSPTLWLELELAKTHAARPDDTTPTFALISRHDPGMTTAAQVTPSTPIASRSRTTDRDGEEADSYPVAEVQALRRATSALQNCALTVLSSELDRHESRTHAHKTREDERSLLPGTSDDRHVSRTPSAQDLDGFMETPEKARRWTHPTSHHPQRTAHRGDADVQNEASASPHTAEREANAVASHTISLFTPHTLRMERQLYEAASAVQTASAAVQAHTRRAAEREREYLQAVLFAPSSPSSPSPPASHRLTT